MDAVRTAWQTGEFQAAGAVSAASTASGCCQVMFDLQTTAGLLLIAIAVDAVLGDPDWLWRRLPHPVTLMGRLIDGLDGALNRADGRRLKGVLALLVMLVVVILVGVAIQAMIDIAPVTMVLEVVIVAIMLAQRSLYEHVARVRHAFADSGLAAARRAVSMIVGRDPETLDESGVSRAAIESTAENFSDGVVAPAFWYLVAGLPGLLAYKMVNTADSMIGHRNEKYEEFGWASARLDDVLNLVPARLSAVFVAIAAAVCAGSFAGAWRAVRSDAHRHRSPNAGWPEAAMAGGLGLALAGPRVYGDTVVDDPWMNSGGRREAHPDDISRALAFLVAACGVQAVLIALFFGVSLL